MCKKELKRFEYKGELLTLSQLSAINGVPTTSINNRMMNGWDIEDAITLPVTPSKQLRPLPAMFAEGRVVEVIFRNYIPGVYNHMQPKLMKRYRLVALPSKARDPIFTIELENGKPLIVYPNEFEIVYAEIWVKPELAMA